MKLKDYLKEQFQDIKGMYQFSDGGSVSMKGSTIKEPGAITPKAGIASFRVGLDQFTKWSNKNAQEMVVYVMNWWGPPNILTHKKAMWFKIAGFDKVCVKNEGVPHVGMGEFHVDHLHCSKDIAVPPEHLSQLAEFLPNVMYDGLKKQVTVRCNDIIMNAVTLGFVEKVAVGEMEPTSDNFMASIDAVNIPNWFERVNHEWLHQEEYNDQYVNWKDQMDRHGGKYGRGYHMHIGKAVMDMETDFNIKEGFEEIPKGESPDIDWSKLENPDEKEYLNKTLKKVLKTKDPATIKKLKNFHKSGKVHIDFKSLENERDKEYLNRVLKEGFITLKEVAEYYVEFYPEFTPDSIEKGLKAAWKKHETLDPITVKYYLTEKRFGGLGFGKEK